MNLGVAAMANFAVQSAVVAGTAQARYASLYSAMKTLRDMRAYIVEVTFPAHMDYYVVLSVATTGADFDNVSKAITYPSISAWARAWVAVSAAAAPGTPVLAASGQTVREVIRLLDQILFLWGQKKLDEFYVAATAETRKANEAVQRAQAQAAAEADRRRIAAESDAAARSAAAAELATRQRIAAESDAAARSAAAAAAAEQQRIAAAADAAARSAAAAELATRQRETDAAVAKEAHDKTIMWIGVGAGVLAVAGIGIYLARR